MEIIPVELYNYEIFSINNAMPLLRFNQSPALGQEAPDFPLWDLDGRRTSLRDVWSQNTYTIVEFGSFT